MLLVDGALNQLELKVIGIFLPLCREIVEVSWNVERSW